MVNAPTLPTGAATGDLVTLHGETYYRIANYDAMPPFFMTIVSSADHWLFVATTGGLTAGRVDADHALFPYYTEDRLTENADNTGPKTLFHVTRGDTLHLWEPFAPRHHTRYPVSRNLYKNVAGTAVVFEEANPQLGLTFRYAWRASAAFGLVRTAWLHNDSPDAVAVTVTDGLQNVLPAQVTAATQNAFSVLLDAYKRSELDTASGVGIYALSSRLTDLAEPSEALRANTVWQAGLPATVYLLSASQVAAVRAGHAPTPETDVRGGRGAYFAHARLTLDGGAEHTWHIVAEVHQDAAAVADLIAQVRATDDRYAAVAADIAATHERLVAIVAGADGVQVSGDALASQHHFANVLFNVMRGGTFANQYHLDRADFLRFLRTHDRALPGQHAAFLAGLPPTFTVHTLKNLADAQPDPNLKRLCYTYLPLTFSRRHGDPSRPWNRFSIQLRAADGSPRLSYEGNWRDIFQNWEALAQTYPAFIDGMICVFLSATTRDGYNPYRITRDGIDWEVPEPENPWANIGYWSDHQIIYLLKLLEFSEHHYPGKLRGLLATPLFAYADVPYRIKPYTDILRDADNTITYDDAAAAQVAARVQAHGTDGRLVMDTAGAVVHTTLAEKLLNLLLAKLVNVVPGGGVWMNTQRPEWNDANNALVGKGLSIVTTAYLRRYVAFLAALLADAPATLPLSRELHGLFTAVNHTLAALAQQLDSLTPAARRAAMDALGEAGSAYRAACYAAPPSGEVVDVATGEVLSFLKRAQHVLDATLRANRRAAGLYHAYNTLSLGDGNAQVGHLQPMLEGQVAVLSAGLLAPPDALELLRQLRQSALYRPDQHSYLLYPDRDLPGFLAKNTFDAAQVAGLPLVQALLARGDRRLIVQDTGGACHFSGDLRNARDLQQVLAELAAEPDLAPHVAADAGEVLALFERVFNHSQFTGRSGSFFAYEGLGSIYWHMVSKLLLAVQENVYHAAALESDTLPALVDAYYDIRAGLGFNKPPAVYGAFPLDPYSHTPRDQGAKQPGMTGMVKEEILTRLGELGLRVRAGRLLFDPTLLRADVWLGAPATLAYWDTANTRQQLAVPAGAYALTFCRVPVVVLRGDHDALVLHLADDTRQTVPGHTLDATLSAGLFAHNGHIRQLTVHYRPGA